MADLAFYRAQIRRILGDYVSLVKRTSPAKGVDTLAVFDEADDLYMVYRVGWDGDFRVHTVPISVRIIDGKIWLEEDWTEEEIAQQLLDAGISKEDVCLGFNDPLLREEAETTAVA